MKFARHDPTDAVERAYVRIQHERMADVPILNPSLAVQAVDFQRWQGHWLGVLVTPWCMSLLLLPGGTGHWASTSGNQRRFVKFPAGDFAFLGGEEAELGEYQSCSLFSPMGQFACHDDAVQTARAALGGLLTPSPAPETPAPTRCAQKPSLSRRGFLALRSGR